MCLVFNVCTCVIKSVIIYYQVCILGTVISADLNFINQVKAAANNMTLSCFRDRSIKMRRFSLKLGILGIKK